ncbi:BTAD domain-containing putative transcriptional regulator [Streptomyces sp. NPDC049954]|uniref:BTAD domain-containing putative transcriptional regulator n=1 Tax=Streptomyces sp. NPDC049954 TaxID=3155779 RepID=UPI0034331A07
MRYRILGATEAYDDSGAPVRLGGARLRTLLTALALRAGRTAGVDTLIDEVWEEDPPSDAPAALQALVGRLRRVLGRSAIASAPGGYRLDVPPDDVDVHRFTRLATEGAAALDAGEHERAARLLHEALDLWRGPALADLPGQPGAARRPEDLRRTALRHRAEADLALGRPPAALVAELRELTEAAPYDEPLHALLLRALRADGRPADALAAYERVRHTLAERLGTSPGPELRRVHEELLHEDARTATASPPFGRDASPSEPARPPQSPAAAPRGNLRPRLTSFVGREPELAAIRAELRTSRLVTLTGPGGSGKTRLAEEAAATLPQAWLAELAPLERPEAVPGAVVSALGLRDTLLGTGAGGGERGPAAAQEPLDLLIDHCASRELLLILDNCEHVVEAAAELAETLLTRCPRLTVLATSREPLGVPGESVRPVDPLPEAPAARLFAERGAAVRQDFRPEDDAEAVEEICRRLDGLPLAIELAAARLRMLTPRQIADRLDDRFRLLTGGSRTVLPRQQTLRAVVDWSWDLLDEAERTVLCEASVFAGGWDLAAAEAVCSGPVAALTGSLVDKSLLVAAPAPAGDGMRYRMLETIHEYAAERAAGRTDLLDAAGRRHGQYFLAFVTRADPLMRSAGQLPWIRRTETELDNIRAALSRAVRLRDEDLATGLVLRTGWFWWLRNYRVEGAAWAGHTLSLHDEATATLMEAFNPRAPGGRNRDARQEPVRRQRGEPDRAREQCRNGGPGRAQERAQERSEEQAQEPSGGTARDDLGGDDLRGDDRGHDGPGRDAPAEPPADLTGDATRHVSGPGVSGPGVSGRGGSTPDASARGGSGLDVSGLHAADETAGPSAAESGRPSGGDSWSPSGGDAPADSGAPSAGRFGDPADPRYWPRINLRLLHLFLLSETRAEQPPGRGAVADYVASLRAAYRGGGPESASFPGLLWAFTSFFLGTPEDARPLLDETVDTCRRHGGDWELGVALMFRTHVAVDTPGRFSDVEGDLAEVQEVAARTGDRWMLAQVHSARAEAAMAAGRHEEARPQFEEALRLAHEVGAHAEAPFLLARLGELAYRAGNKALMTAYLDEASSAAESYGTVDAAAFITVLRGQKALEDGDTAQGRAFYEAARAEAERGSPPPQFTVMLDMLGAQVTEAVDGPAKSLPLVRDALRGALDAYCSDAIVAALVELGASTLAALHQDQEAVRALTCGGRLRAGRPRPEPEHSRAEETAARAGSRLGPERYARAVEQAATYGPEDLYEAMTTLIAT